MYKTQPSPSPNASPNPNPKTTPSPSFLSFFATYPKNRRETFNSSKYVGESYQILASDSKKKQNAKKERKEEEEEKKKQKKKENRILQLLHRGRKRHLMRSCPFKAKRNRDAEELQTIKTSGDRDTGQPSTPAPHRHLPRFQGEIE